MSNIVPRAAYGAQPPVKIDRPTLKAMEAIRSAGIIRQSQAYVAAREAEDRIETATDMAKLTARRVTSLNQEVTELTRDNPGLEMTLRPLEAMVVAGSADVIYRFLRGQY